MDEFYYSIVFTKFSFPLIANCDAKFAFSLLHSQKYFSSSQFSFFHPAHPQKHPTKVPQPTLNLFPPARGNSQRSRPPSIESAPSTTALETIHPDSNALLLRALIYPAKHSSTIRQSLGWEIILWKTKRRPQTRWAASNLSHHKSESLNSNGGGLILRMKI